MNDVDTYFVVGERLGASEVTDGEYCTVTKSAYLCKIENSRVLFPDVIPIVLD